MSTRQERIDAIITGVKALKEQRGDTYRVEPTIYVPIDILIAQAALKGIRAYEKKDSKEKKEELRDCMNYCIFAIERIDEAEELLQLRLKQPIPGI